MSADPKLLDALKRAEAMLFGAGAPLGTENYFNLRKVLRDAINSVEVNIHAKPAKQWYRVRLTRDVTMTQSVDVELVATSPDEAEGMAVDLPQAGLNWEDDDDSWHYGENGTYIADPGNSAKPI